MAGTLLQGAGLLVLLAPSVALADASLVATGAASTGYSTNIEGVPEGDAAREVEGDGFTDLSPGLAAAYETRRTIHNLNYTFGARLFLTNSEANSFTNTLNYQSLITVSPRSTMRFGAGFNSGRINSFDQAGTEVVGEGDVLPSGDIEFIAYNANGSFRHLLTQNWTGEVQLTLAQFEPSGEEDVEVSSTRTVGQVLRLDRTFRRHLLGIEGRALYNRQSGIESERTLTIGPGVFWTWNITDSISSNTTAGLDVVGQYPDLNRGVTVPRGSVALTYSHERGRATAGATRGATTNLLGGDTTVTTGVFANLGLPLPFKRPTAVTLASAYSTGEILDIDSGIVRGTTKRLSGDISVATQLNRAWQLGVRLESSKQENPIIDDMGVETNFLTRQTVGLVVLQGRFPEAVAAQVPPRRGDRVESGNAAFTQQSQGGAAGGAGGGGGDTRGGQDR